MILTIWLFSDAKSHILEILIKISMTYMYIKHEIENKKDTSDMTLAKNKVCVA